MAVHALEEADASELLVEGIVVAGESALGLRQEVLDEVRADVAGGEFVTRLGVERDPLDRLVEAPLELALGELGLGANSDPRDPLRALLGALGCAVGMARARWAVDDEDVAVVDEVRGDSGGVFGVDPVLDLSLKFLGDILDLVAGDTAGRKDRLAPVVLDADDDVAAV
ncbi:MAG TPA: hypothetical protein PKW35_07990 [Nannocystaceae bacterium]|nr:hypothetical protein [Nannocystaceae bacterium]